MDSVCAHVLSQTADNKPLKRYSCRRFEVACPNLEIDPYGVSATGKGFLTIEMNKPSR